MNNNKKTTSKNSGVKKKNKNSKVTYLTSLEQKILTSNLGEKLKKERLEVKVAESALKDAQKNTIIAEESFNSSREDVLVIKEQFMKLQNDLKIAKIEADKSDSEAKRRDMQLLEQTIKAQESVSKRLEEEYQETLRQIEQAESKALKARKDSEETYNKISDEVLSDVEQNMREKIEDELDEIGEKTQVIDMVRTRIDHDQAMEDELNLLRLKNEEADIRQQVAKAESNFLNETSEESKEAYTKEQLGLGQSGLRNIK